MMLAQPSQLSSSQYKNQTENSDYILPQQKDGDGVGLVIELDAKSGTKSGPRFDPRFVGSRKAVAIIPKFTGGLSVMGSSYILFDIVVRNRGNKMFQTTFHRLLIGLAIADLLSSLAYCLSHWMFPSQVPMGTDPEWYQVLFPYATGNQATCATQGFIMQMGQCASIIFTACISIQFVLKIRYRWTASQMRRAEYVFFTFGILLPLATSLTAVSIGAMNPTAGGTCWISAYPFFCMDSYVGWCRENKTWGVHQDQYKFLMGTVPILVGLVIVLGSMVLLYLTARRCALQEQQRRSKRRLSSSNIINNGTPSRRRSISSTNAEHQRRAQKTVLFSASLYLGMFLCSAQSLHYVKILVVVVVVSYTWSTISSLVLQGVYIFIYVIVIAAFLTRGAVNVVLVIVLPIQGFLNAMIYSGRIHLIHKRIIREGARRSSSISMSGLSMLTSSRIVSSTDPNPLHENRNSSKPSTSGVSSSDPGQDSISIAPPDVASKAAPPVVVVKPQDTQ
jgi:hypothetical protein